MANARTVKRREQRWRKSYREDAEAWALALPDAVVNQLCGLDHPKIDSDEHSMYSYVLWLCSKGYWKKALEVVDGNTSSN